MNLDDDYRDLANAIIKQAAWDYRTALCRYHKNPSLENHCKVESLERFFKGEAIKTYTKLDGPSLMRRIKDHVIACDFNMCKIRKETAIFRRKSEEESVI